LEKGGLDKFGISGIVRRGVGTMPGRKLLLASFYCVSENSKGEMRSDVADRGGTFPFTIRERETGP